MFARFAGAESKDEGGRRGRIYDIRRFPVASTVLAKRSRQVQKCFIRFYISFSSFMIARKHLVFKYLINASMRLIYVKSHLQK